MYLSSCTIILLGLLWWFTLWNQEREHAKRLEHLLRPEEAAYEAWMRAYEATTDAMEHEDEARARGLPPEVLQDCYARVRLCEIRQQAAYDVWQAVRRPFPTAQGRAPVPPTAAAPALPAQ